jgi:tRNA-Thr(GGU) m(6)t(6)A37 methyltransferase TsaA
MNSISYRPIGIIYTPFEHPEGAPIQNKGAEGVEGTIYMNEDLVEGLSDLEGFSHLYLLYHFHQSRPFRLKVKPFMDQVWRGVFATRAPARPNAIGLSVVRLKAIRANQIQVLDIDVVNKTPLLDIKPYIPQFDSRHKVSIGWMEGKAGSAQYMRADDRFVGHQDES